jgi:hypothetical protein
VVCPRNLVPAGVLDNDQERALRDKSWQKLALRLNLLVQDLNGRYTSAKVVSVREAPSQEP